MAAILASDDDHNFVGLARQRLSSRSKLINFRPDQTHHEVRLLAECIGSSLVLDSKTAILGSNVDVFVSAIHESLKD